MKRIVMILKHYPRDFQLNKGRDSPGRAGSRHHGEERSGALKDIFIDTSKTRKTMQRLGPTLFTYRWRVRVTISRPC